MGNLCNTVREVALDRTSITGPISEDMPDLVLLEVARSGGISVHGNELDLRQRNSIIATYQRQQLPRVELPVSKSGMSRVALYVNESRALTWRSSELLASFEWLYDHPYLPTSKLLERLVIHGFGNPTPSANQRLCGTLLYAWCKRLNISTRRDTEMREMYEGILHTITDARVVRSIFYHNIAMDNCDLLITMLNSQNLHNQGEEVAEYHSAELVPIFEKLQRQNVGQSYEPTTSKEAVVAAVLLHNFDLTWSKMPILDYFRLQNQQPLSSTLVNKIFTIYPRAYRPSHTFNPALPLCAYSPGNISTIARKSLVQGMGNDEIYDGLVLDSMTDTFRNGLHPRITTLESHLGSTNFSEEPELKAISYGSLTNKMVAYEVGELCELFEHNRNFNNPAGGSFEPRAISQLKSICSRKLAKHGRNGNNLWSRLQTAIEVVEHLQSGDEVETRELMQRYFTSTGEQRALIREVILKLQEAALYMRSWQGDPQPWPIRYAPPDYDQDEVDRRVADSLHQMHTAISQGNGQFTDGGWNLNELLKLPLLTWDGERFIRNRNSDHGMTIGGRLNIVQRGNAHENPNSCIRISSNVLMVTSYRYLSLMGATPDYNIRELQYIS